MRMRAGDNGAQWIQPFFFGIPLNGVVAMDTDEGWIDVIMCDDKGKSLHADDGGGWKIERLTGEISYKITSSGDKA